MATDRGRIARTARLIRWAVVAIALLTILFQIAAAFPDSTHIRVHRLNNGPVGLILSLAHSAFTLAALYSLYMLLLQLERGDLFSAVVTRRLRAFAFFTLVAVVVGAALMPLAAALAQQCASEAGCFHRLPLNIQGLWSVVTSLVFFVVAWILDEARRIDLDNQQII